ncbi:MazG nucleotide pyrophosphohydrolase domain-containing protein [Dietzia maris]|uniref:MazG nucleotide pyrophosphohydrolase domain-containing protein n=1 Tax=Dietzia maris TaxID=37915 RepID=UPI00223C0626|nr:MazG nucleotide pyrophosphohydrolase domain-containing protein [Dietzia maris]MCT1432287.1 nucleoside triphosphate hydrolase [Dietzia maris]MCT1519549.1 nucleoside triphosphate hydrolase [Dietzia maris]
MSPGGGRPDSDADPGGGGGHGSPGGARGPSGPSGPSGPGGPGGARDPRREEDFARVHSTDTSETLFSTGAGDRLAEAVEVMARIRRDGEWESAQTHASLLPYLLEESWELVDAVADGDRDELVSELGDLLLQVLFHAAIGAERDESPFDVQDVAGALLDKLRRRAPYWFTDGPGRGPGALDAAEQDRLWQEAKAAERAGRPPRGVVEGISWDMPALALGQKVLERARSAGIPDDLVPDRMRVVHVGAGGLFHAAAHAAAHAADEASDADGSGSAEVEYRRVVREFAETVRAAESRLPVPAAEAGADEWRVAWHRRTDRH